MTSGSTLSVPAPAPTAAADDPSAALSASIQPLSVTSSESASESAHAATVSTNLGTIRRSITLANGTAVEFTSDQVPPPPAVTFVRPSDILTLNGMWDDTTPHWSGESALTINGTPIPIIYWKQIYSSRARGAGPSWKPGQWKALKTHVFNWRVSPVFFCAYQNLFIH